MTSLSMAPAVVHSTITDSAEGMRPAAEWNLTRRERAMAMHPSASGRKLDVLVSADSDLNTVRVIVHGCMSPVNLHALDLVVRRAAALSPDVNVILDLSGAQVSESLRTDLQASSIAARLLSTLAPYVRARLRVIAPPAE